MIKRRIVITGLSGAGKTQALKILEDAGFYCVDNLPPNLMGDFFSHLLSGGVAMKDNSLRKNKKSHPRAPLGKMTPSSVAIGLDIRGILFAAGGYDAISTKPARNSGLGDSRKISALFLKNIGASGGRTGDKSVAIETKIIFLEADTRTLISRYRVTRRKHPLAGGLEKAINTERHLLSGIRRYASVVIDTSNLSLQELKSALLKSVGLIPSKSIVQRGKLSVRVISFGYRFGLPSECDIILDVRFLKNPNYEPRLKYLLGTDPRIQRYIFGPCGDPSGREFLHILEKFFRFLIPRYLAEGKNYLTIGIGCTGGHHRSVAVAQRIGRFLNKTGCEVDVVHRDADKPLVSL